MSCLHYLAAENLEHLTFVQINNDLSPEDIELLAKAPHLQRIQCCEALNEATCQLVLENLLKVFPNLNLRIYNTPESTCDFSFLKHLPKLQSFSVDSIDSITHPETLAALGNLQDLNLHILKLSSFAFLQEVNPGLNSLGLFQTTSKKLDLKALEKFQSLQQLSLQGHKKNIETLGNLASLQVLSLSGITIPEASFLKKIPSLHTLSLNRINKEALDSLTGLKLTESLHLKEIHKLDHLEFLKEIYGVRTFSINKQKHLKDFPSLGFANTLQRMEIKELPAIESLDFLENCQSLQELLITGKNTLEASQLAVLSTLPKLRKVRIGTGNHKKNQEIAKEILGFGLEILED